MNTKTTETKPRKSRAKTPVIASTAAVKVTTATPKPRKPKTDGASKVATKTVRKTVTKDQNAGKIELDAATVQEQAAKGLIMHKYASSTDALTNAHNDFAAAVDVAIEAAENFKEAFIMSPDQADIAEQEAMKRATKELGQPEVGPCPAGIAGFLGSSHRGVAGHSDVVSASKKQIFCMDAMSKIAHMKREYAAKMRAAS